MAITKKTQIPCMIALGLMSGAPAISIAKEYAYQGYVKEKVGSSGFLIELKTGRYTVYTEPCLVEVKRNDAIVVRSDEVKLGYEDVIVFLEDEGKECRIVNKWK